jgi:hypothetical protein
MRDRPASEDDRQLFQKLLGLYDAPAFVRRVRRLEDAERILADHLRRKRDEYLKMVRLRVGQLRALAGNWDSLGSLLQPESIVALHALHEELRPELRMPLAPTRSLRALSAPLAELEESIAVFNLRWQKYVADFDIAPINALREGYNKHYLIEKECAVGNPRVARIGFRRREPLTHAELFEQFPLLVMPIRRE